jgi:hypothetical protein
MSAMQIHLALLRKAVILARCTNMVDPCDKEHVIMKKGLLSNTQVILLLGIQMSSSSEKTKRNFRSK